MLAPLPAGMRQVPLTALQRKLGMTVRFVRDGIDPNDDGRRCEICSHLLEPHVKGNRCALHGKGWRNPEEA